MIYFILQKKIEKYFLWVVIVIKIIIKLLLRKTFTKMQTPPRTPSPLRLPSAVKYPGAPVKKGNNPDYVPIGNNSALNLAPTLERVNNERFTTPPRQRTVPRNFSPQRPDKKKR